MLRKYSTFVPMKILFILKARLYGQAKTSYGLINSANHVAQFLMRQGHECKIVEVIDANSIDKEVYNFRPQVVVIEALWIPTYKFEELLNIKRYEHILWVERIHSDIGYLSVEGNALKLVNEYLGLCNPRLVISFNNKGFVRNLSQAMFKHFTYLPNIIETFRGDCNYTPERHRIDIGCFGALRLLKNQCYQAICAINAADRLNKRLHFHITPNLGVENDPVLNNLKEIFKGKRHELVIHDWLPNDQFQNLIKRMDFGLQISFTESFNIVSADFINNNKLILVSNAISWMPSKLKTSTVNYEETIKKIIYTYKNRNCLLLKELSRECLREYNAESQYTWLKFLDKHF